MKTIVMCAAFFVPSAAASAGDSAMEQLVKGAGVEAASVAAPVVAAKSIMADRDIFNSNVVSNAAVAVPTGQAAQEDLSLSKVAQQTVDLLIKIRELPDVGLKVRCYTYNRKKSPDYTVCDTTDTQYQGSSLLRGFSDTSLASIKSLIEAGHVNVAMEIIKSAFEQGIVNCGTTVTPFEWNGYVIYDYATVRAFRRAVVDLLESYEKLHAPVQK